jgi:hypothetical protein
MKLLPDLLVTHIIAYFNRFGNSFFRESSGFFLPRFFPSVNRFRRPFPGVLTKKPPQLSARITAFALYKCPFLHYNKSELYPVPRPAAGGRGQLLSGRKWVRRGVSG